MRTRDVVHPLWCRCPVVGTQGGQTTDGFKRNATCGVRVGASRDLTKGFRACLQRDERIFRGHSATPSLAEHRYAHALLGLRVERLSDPGS